MRRAVLPLLSMVSLGACASNEPPSDPAVMVQEAQARSDILADRFQKELLSALTAAMAADGPQGAISVCSSIAPALAAQISEESGATVRRTALRTRNPAASPDATERRVMESWAAAPFGVDGKPRRWSAYEGGQYRYMRAIPTMPMCLACHGENVAPEVMAAIRAHYPADQATGFASGQLRGAFSIRWEEAALARAIKGGEGAQRGLHP
ncbi:MULTISPECIES: DUF3365 domain-containing protein [Sphingobium]|jgi:hypothetical protein|uniref:Cytochrome c domain-containing protein n=8 Tax=Alphaproteobacteria TaxID=28211 RepID=A0A0S3F1C0_9SPHN|nr:MULTISPECIES: DUF3365 domain-containing protein [Sphingobium]ALR21411.1 hypothetical protein ATN00_15050 [Sphingobium baderi]AMG72997.1 Glutamate synthase domain-containing 2 [Sphingopyxis granuli]AMK18110.1 hypothetical protein K663_08645 [Sphingobium sp. MI1205]ARR56430.1 hypothetical protein HY78_24770 [Rhizorhabdus wittichii DC-6]RIA46459.1 uncharacterized protein DUF3365 [Hephaestia caeni]BBD97628.1 DUF3365 domain-containing protein [Sphingobium amiense]